MAKGQATVATADLLELLTEEEKAFVNRCDTKKNAQAGGGGIKLTPLVAFLKAVKCNKVGVARNVAQTNVTYDPVDEFRLSDIDGVKSPVTNLKDQVSKTILDLPPAILAQIADNLEEALRETKALFQAIIMSDNGLKRFAYMLDLLMDKLERMKKPNAIIPEIDLYIPSPSHKAFDKILSARPQSKWWHFSSHWPPFDSSLQKRLNMEDAEKHDARPRKFYLSGFGKISDFLKILSNDKYDLEVLKGIYNDFRNGDIEWDIGDQRQDDFTLPEMFANWINVRSITEFITRVDILIRRAMQAFRKLPPLTNFQFMGMYGLTEEQIQKIVESIDTTFRVLDAARRSEISMSVAQLIRNRIQLARQTNIVESEIISLQNRMVDAIVKTFRDTEDQLPRNWYSMSSIRWTNTNLFVSIATTRYSRDVDFPLPKILCNPMVLSEDPPRAPQQPQSPPETNTPPMAPTWSLLTETQVETIKRGVDEAFPAVLRDDMREATARMFVDLIHDRLRKARENGPGVSQFNYVSLKQEMVNAIMKMLKDYAEPLRSVKQIDEPKLNNEVFTFYDNVDDKHVALPLPGVLCDPVVLPRELHVGGGAAKKKMRRVKGAFRVYKGAKHPMYEGPRGGLYIKRSDGRFVRVKTQ